MIRKQIFIEERQNEALKRLALRTGRSEGALIREAVERRLAEEQVAEAAWEDLLERWSRSPAPEGPRTWTRDDLYEERVGRFDGNTH